MLSLVSSYGCTKQNSVVNKIKVNNCSYVDEYFDYCKPAFIKEYSKLLNTGTVNFNQKFILAPIGNSSSYSGVVAIDKATGNVETMKFGFKQSSLKKKIESQINSDVFCIDGEVNSKSLSINKIGKSCFKFDNEGFIFLNERKSESKNVYPIIFGNTKFKCGSKNCEFKSLDEENLKKISKNESSALRFIINEKGFDSSYLDASDDKNILYVIRYTDGDNEIENLNLAYFYQGNFKVKLLGSLKSLKIIDSRRIKFNGKDITLN